MADGLGTVKSKIVKVSNPLAAWGKGLNVGYGLLDPSKTDATEVGLASPMLETRTQPLRFLRRTLGLACHTGSFTRRGTDFTSSLVTGPTPLAEYDN